MKDRQTQTICFLDGYKDSTRSTWRTVVRTLPFVVGRRPDADMVLPSPTVSGRHAELRTRGDQMLLCDLGSTNGTFVNGHRVTRCRRVEDGDYLHFGDQEFVLVIPAEGFWYGLTAAMAPTSALGTAQLPAALFEGEQMLRNILSARAVTSHFQPIVSLDSDTTVGWEALGRGLVQDVAVGPTELFRSAESCELEIELAELFRHNGFEEARSLPAECLLFFNTHPSELVSPARFLDHLASLRREFSAPRLVLEVHEQAVPSSEALQKLRRGLERLDVEIAFDDFGTGQARLRELVEVEPRFVKFDVAWIRGIDSASNRRRDMIAKLVRLITDMGVETLAEGVENRREAEACRSLGFGHAQGYFFGNPLPASQLAQPDRLDAADAGDWGGDEGSE